VVIPDQCLLNPSSTAAVVGGNVLTSQRVTDVVLKAFGAAAASQAGPGVPADFMLYLAPTSVAPVAAFAGMQLEISLIRSSKST
jgi:hypothetical protein